MEKYNNEQNIEEEIDKTESLVNSARKLRAKFLNDRYRPGYHIVTPEGLCGPFDPNGAIFWKGKYHLFYIFQNEKGHCWGHISSKDLVHWRHHPVALEPGDGDKMVFSGGASVDRNGTPTITYWGVDNGICIATSNDDELDCWTKSPHNPVIRETAHGYAVNENKGEQVVYGVADPTAIWLHNKRYYMLTGNLLVLREFGLKQNNPQHLGDTAYLFVSDDLNHWEYLHPFYNSSRQSTRKDEDNMCPDFFPLPTSMEGGQLSESYMMLFISHNLGCQYYIGNYEDEHFFPETHGRMTWVDSAFFAPESLIDDKGRRIMWAWIFDGRKETARKLSGWSGTMSLPRVLWLGDDKTLKMSPPKELALLRYNPKKLENITVKAGNELRLKDIRGNSLELNIEMNPQDAKQSGVKICCSPNSEEQTVIFYDAAEKKLNIDTTKSSLDQGPKSVESGPFELQSEETLKLRVFIDKSVVEVFANNRQAVMRRIYPAREDSVNISLFSNEGATRVKSIKAWDMMPSNQY